VHGCKKITNDGGLTRSGTYGNSGRQRVNSPSNFRRRVLT